MVVRPFQSETGYTQFHNYILDEIMPAIDPNAWKVLCLIIRKTQGWHKEEDDISYSQIMAASGIKSRSTVSKALEELLSKGYVLARKAPHNTTAYRINREWEAPTSPENGLVQQLDKSIICTSGGPENGLGVVQLLDTQKKDIKKEKKELPQAAHATAGAEKIGSHPVTLMVARACRIDMSVADFVLKQQVYQSAKILIKEGYTADEVEAGGRHWYTANWKSGYKTLPMRERTPPTPAQLRTEAAEVRLAARQAAEEEAKQQAARRAPIIEAEKTEARYRAKANREATEKIMASWYTFTD